MSLRNAVTQIVEDAEKYLVGFGEADSPGEAMLRGGFRSVLQQLRLALKASEGEAAFPIPNYLAAGTPQVFVEDPMVTFNRRQVEKARKRVREEKELQEHFEKECLKDESPAE